MSPVSDRAHTSIRHLLSDTPESEPAWNDAARQAWSKLNLNDVGGYAAMAIAAGVTARVGKGALTQAAKVESLAGETAALAKPAIVTRSEQIGSVLSNPTNVQELAQGLFDRAKTWPSLDRSVRRIERAQEKLGTATEQLNDTLRSRGIADDVSILTNAELQALGRSPALQAGDTASIRGVLTKRRTFLSSQDDLLTAIDGRANSWQNEINQFAGRHNLPEAVFESRRVEVTAQGRYGNGVANVDPAFMIRGNDVQFATKVAVHEVTHHEQGYLMISRQADKMGVGVQPTPDQILGISRVLPSSHSSPDWITDALYARAGRRLSRDAEARADRLLASEAALDDVMKPGEIKFHRQWFDSLEKRSAKDSIAELFGPKGETVARVLAVDGHGARAMLDRYASAHARLDKPWSPTFTSRMQSMLTEDLNRARKLIDDKESTYDTAYRSAYHEQEAWRNGSIALEHVLRR